MGEKPTNKNMNYEYDIENKADKTPIFLFLFILFAIAVIVYSNYNAHVQAENERIEKEYEDRMNELQRMGESVRDLSGNRNNKEVTIHIYHH